MSIALLTRKVLEAFHSDLPGPTGARLRDELGRFRIWAGNISAHRPKTSRRSLEYRLRDSSNLQTRVLALLQDLQSALASVKAIVDLPSNVERDDPDDSGHGDTTDGNGSEIFEIDDEEPLTEAEVLGKAMDEVEEVTDCLMRLSIALRNPARHDQMREGMSSKWYEPFARQHVQAKFEQTPEYLVQRLSKSISRHRQYFNYRLEHHHKLAEGLDDPIPLQGAEERPSTVATSLWTPVTNIQAPSMTALIHDDAESVATATSYAGTETGGEAHLRPPPWPEAAQDGKPFECPICYGFVEAPTERSWQQHVYEDIPPYICVHETCTSGDKNYSRRKDWLHHISHDHNRCWICPYGCEETFDLLSEFEAHLSQSHQQNFEVAELQNLADACSWPSAQPESQTCILCSKEYPNQKRLHKHLGHHLEQLTLFALPKHLLAEDVDDNESEASSDRSGPRMSNEEGSDTRDLPSPPPPELAVLGHHASDTRYSPLGSLYVRAIRDYQAVAETELSFREGDLIEVLETRQDVDWEIWRGVLKFSDVLDNEMREGILGVSRGYFPLDHCVVLPRVSPHDSHDVEQEISQSEILGSIHEDGLLDGINLSTTRDAYLEARSGEDGNTSGMIDKSADKAVPSVQDDLDRLGPINIPLLKRSVTRSKEQGILESESSDSDADSGADIQDDNHDNGLVSSPEPRTGDRLGPASAGPSDVSMRQERLGQDADNNGDDNSFATDRDWLNLQLGPPLNDGAGRNIDLTVYDPDTGQISTEMSSYDTIARITAEQVSRQGAVEMLSAAETEGDNARETFREACVARKAQYEAELHAVPSYTLSRRSTGKPPIDAAQLQQLSNKVDSAHAFYQLRADQDWRNVCLRYPMVLDHYKDIQRSDKNIRDTPRGLQDTVLVGEAKEARNSRSVATFEKREPDFSLERELSDTTANEGSIVAVNADNSKSGRAYSTVFNPDVEPESQSSAVSAARPSAVTGSVRRRMLGIADVIKGRIGSPESVDIGDPADLSALPARTSRASLPDSPALITPLEQLADIRTTLLAFIPDVDKFCDKPPINPAPRELEYKRLTEGLLTQVLLNLENLEANADDDLRTKRRALLRQTHNLLKVLDATKDGHSMTNALSMAIDREPERRSTDDDFQNEELSEGVSTNDQSETQKPLSLSYRIFQFQRLLDDQPADWSKWASQLQELEGEVRAHDAQYKLCSPSDHGTREQVLTCTRRLTTWSSHHVLRKNSRRQSISSVHSQNSDLLEDSDKGLCPIPTCARHVKDLKAHMLTHQNERPEKCPIPTCEYSTKGFARKYDKNRHTLTHYKGTMVCGFCPGSGSVAEKSFNRVDVFKRHLISVHGVEQRPPNARRESLANSAKDADRSLSSICSICSVTFASAQDFYEHFDACVIREVMSGSGNDT